MVELVDAKVSSEWGGKFAVQWVGRSVNSFPLRRSASNHPPPLALLPCLHPTGWLLTTYKTSSRRSVGILGHLLFDTPGKPNSTSILRTCSPLHRLGLLHLYRVGESISKLYHKQSTLRNLCRTLFTERGVIRRNEGWEGT